MGDFNQSTLNFSIQENTAPVLDDQRSRIFSTFAPLLDEITFSCLTQVNTKTNSFGSTLDLVFVDDSLLDKKINLSSFLSFFL